jgi:signal transduction histidine kinase
MRRLVQRIRRSPRDADIALAVAFAVPSLLQVLWIHPIASRPVGALVALGTTVPLAFRRSHPVPAALAGSLFWLIPTDGYPVLGLIVAFFLYYSVGAYVADVRVVVAAAAAGLVLGEVGTVLHDETSIGEYLGSAIFVLLPAAVGRFVRAHREQNARLEELTVHLERERERGARAAVAEERARIARELHDVVSHGVSAIAIQSDAAEAALDHDPELARAPLKAIRGEATDALGDMRRLLGMLRTEDDATERAPLPGLADLPALVERARDGGGATVAVEVEGTPRRLPATVDLSAYRIVQEALTNARKHAPGGATAVTLTWRDDALELRVVNARATRPPANGGPPPDGGHGLIGMRERVRLCGGELRAGPDDGGGFEVLATLPTGAPA